MTVQTTVEVPHLLGVHRVEIPQVQFLDKFDTPFLYNSRHFCTIQFEVAVSSSSVFQLWSTWTLLSLFFQLWVGSSEFAVDLAE